jgi:hypothetical protein
MTVSSFTFTLPVQELTAPAWYSTAVSNGWAVNTWARITGGWSNTSDNLTVRYLQPTHGLAHVNNALDVHWATSPGAMNPGFFKAYRNCKIAAGHRTHGALIAGPGGTHNLYGQGDGYLFDIGTRTWEQLWDVRDWPNPSPELIYGDGYFAAHPWTLGATSLNSDGVPIASGSDELNGAPFGEYVDGCPIHNHQVGYVYYNPPTSEFVMVKGWGHPASGSANFRKLDTGHAINLDTLDANGFSEGLWQRFGGIGTIPELVSPTDPLHRTAFSQIRSGTYDPVTESWWMICQNGGRGAIIRYHRASNQWFFYGYCTGTWFNGEDFSVVDPVRNVLIYCATSSQLPNANGKIGLLDIGNGGANATKRGNKNNNFWLPVTTGTPPNINGFLGGNPGSMTWTNNARIPGDPTTPRSGFLFWQIMTTIDANVRVWLAEYVGPSTPSFPAGAATDYALHWTEITDHAANGTVRVPLLTNNGRSQTGSGGGGGVWEGFQIVKWGDTEVAVYAAGADEPVYAYRVT